MRNYVAKIGSALLLVAVVVGAMWFDRVNNAASLVDAVVERVIDYTEIWQLSEVLVHWHDSSGFLCFGP